MVITSYTFLYPFGYHCNRLCNSTATSLAVVLQPLCSNAAAPMQYPISYEF